MASVNRFTPEETRTKREPFTAREAVLELDLEDLKKDTGVQTILDRLENFVFKILIKVRT